MAGTGAAAPDHGQLALDALADAAGLGDRPDQPLAVALPSASLLLQYPLIAANVRTLCDPDSWMRRGSSSIATTVQSINSTWRVEGMVGVYRGAHFYLLHMACRDALKLAAEQGFRFAERRTSPEAPQPIAERSGNDADDMGTALVAAGPPPLTNKMFWWRTAAKYAIEAACYPMLLLSTRYVILHGDRRPALEQMRCWRDREGLMSLFGGVVATLISMALDEVMDWVLSKCVDYCSDGTDVEAADKLLIKASGSSVVSIFTSPMNYVGVIQRCQSNTPCMLQPKPVKTLLWSLPWKGSAYQFVLFSGILAVNVSLIQWKIQLQAEMEKNDPHDPNQSDDNAE